MKLYNEKNNTWLRIHSVFFVLQIYSLHKKRKLMDMKNVIDKFALAQLTKPIQNVTAFWQVL